MRPSVTVPEMKELERITIEEYKIDAAVLMERAAISVADVVCANISGNAKVVCLCGTGNNGADGIATVRILRERGINAYAYINYGHSESELFKRQLHSLQMMFPEALLNVERDNPDAFSMVNTGLDNRVSINTVNAGFDNSASLNMINADIYIDALLGIGITKDVDERTQTLIDLMNNSGKNIISIDVPSGLDATTGRVCASCVKSTVTVTMGFVKTGLVSSEGVNYTGELRVADIGIVCKTYDKSSYIIPDNNDYKLMMPFRPENGHKGTFGKTTIYAGSETVSGAAMLATMSAFRAGVGMVKTVTHANNLEALKCLVPEAMLSEFCSDEIPNDMDDVLTWSDTICAGPGIGTSEGAKKRLEYIFDNAKCPVVVDADAINLIAMHEETKVKFENMTKRVPVVITPHKAEKKRLFDSFGVDSTDEFLKKVCCILVDKDAKTRIYGDVNVINMSGNSGMATAGSGDVLTGIIGALCANRNMEDISTAAILGVYIHGLAGDVAANEIGKISMTAADMVNAIPKALALLV